jgi:hypothetical protein
VKEIARNSELATVEIKQIVLLRANKKKCPTIIEMANEFP